jgi:hypothetical protein
MVYSLKDILQLREYTDYDTYLRGTDKMSSLVPLEDYLKEYYGICSETKCTCLRLGSVGTSCKNWVTAEAKTFEELAEWQNKLK